MDPNRTGLSLRLSQQATFSRPYDPSDWKLHFSTPFHRLILRQSVLDGGFQGPSRWPQSRQASHCARLMTSSTLDALSADFTGQGLRERLNLPDIPVITLAEAGKRLANLSQVHHFSLFEYWLSDYAGHAQDMPAACRLLRDFDRVIAALLEEWDFEKGLIVITSDHGNLEDLSTRRHTLNDVPCLVIGDEGMRRRFVQDLRDLTGIAPAIRRYFTADGT